MSPPRVETTNSPPGPKRRPGRPPTYVFSKPDAELSENERRLKGSVIKRRLRQNRSYHRKKRIKELADHAARSAPAARAAHPAPASQFQHQTFPVFSAAPSQPPAPPGRDQAIPIVASAGMRSGPSAPDALSFLAMNVSRALNVPSVSLPSSQGFRTLPPAALAAGVPLDLAMASSSHDKILGSPALSDAPRFDGSMIQRPSPTVQVRVQNSRGTPFLSVSSVRGPTVVNTNDSNSNDKDEAQLLAYILDGSDDRHSDTVTTVACGPSARPFLNQDLDNRMSSLPNIAGEGLKHLVLFPGSFTAESALYVMGISPQPSGGDAGTALRPFVNVKLLRELSSGRFELCEITKSLISNESFDDAPESQHRFVSYFIAKLRSLDPKSMSSKGETRLNAMTVYDAERNNMTLALQMCRDMGGKRLIMEFLTHAATVMRYSTSAHDRAQVFDHVLSEAESSSRGETTDVQAEARLRLALGEAYFDLLELDKAEDHLQRAIALVAGTEGGSLPVSTSVLVLLLMAELRTSERDFDEARKLLFQALKSLKDAELQNSTFGVCCLLNLASVYMSLNQLDEATHSVNTALEVLTDLGFSRMPIYADALGTLGSVHVHKGNWDEAQKLFYSGLTLIQSWMLREDWDRAPFQHCIHLDIFLVEAIAQTYTSQNRHGEADQLLGRALEQRQERGLGSPRGGNAGGGGNSRESRRYGRLYTRHLY